MILQWFERLLYYILKFHMHIKVCFGGFMLEESFKSERNNCAISQFMYSLLESNGG